MTLDVRMLPGLKLLSIQNSRLRTAPDLSGNPALQKFVLSSSRLVEPPQFEHNLQLREVNLASCVCLKNAPEVGHLPLKLLSMYQCPSLDTEKMEALREKMGDKLNWFARYQ